MLAHDGIIFFERQLFGLRAWIFLGDIEKASVRRAGELDLDGSWLSHLPETLYVKMESRLLRGSRGLLGYGGIMSSACASIIAPG